MGLVVGGEPMMAHRDEVEADRLGVLADLVGTGEAFAAVARDETREEEPEGEGHQAACSLVGSGMPFIGAPGG